MTDESQYKHELSPLFCWLQGDDADLSIVLIKTMMKYIWKKYGYLSQTNYSLCNDNVKSIEIKRHSPDELLQVVHI